MKSKVRRRTELATRRQGSGAACGWLWCGACVWPLVASGSLNVPNSYPVRTLLFLPFFLNERTVLPRRNLIGFKNFSGPQQDTATAVLGLIQSCADSGSSLLTHVTFQSRQRQVNSCRCQPRIKTMVTGSSRNSKALKLEERTEESQF